MERAVDVFGACGTAIRIPRTRPSGLRRFDRIRLVVVAAIVTGSAPHRVCAQDPAPPSSPSGAAAQRALLDSGRNGLPRNILAPIRPGEPLAARPTADSAPPPSPAPVAVTGSTTDLGSLASQRFKVRVPSGQCVVARYHGQFGRDTALILPDGQLGVTKRLIPTEQPFQPLTPEQLQTVLLDGPFADYHLLKTDHYLIFYKSSIAFAQDSGRLLEDLYRGMIDTFRRKEIPVHESEFPLVAVIFATERDFRNHKQVDPQVQAYYEFFTNRIFFYQKSDRDKLEPKVAALLKPQTVAHEGAHQILSNIGVQPRPSSWPLWLIEGLAEYCATTVNSKKGIMWSGMGAINSLHMATIRELEDPLSNQVNGAIVPAVQVARHRSTMQAELLMEKTSLTPPDYAQAWALTHYLAMERGGAFVDYLKAMSRIPPMQPRTPQENLDEFRKFFGDDMARLDKKVDVHIHKLSLKKAYDALFYYAVVFHQSLGNGMVRRAAYVSQSPQMIQQWVLDTTSPHGDVPNWEATPWPTRAQAIFAAEAWMRGN